MQPLKLVTHHWSTNINKGYDTYYKLWKYLKDLPNISFKFIGREFNQKYKGVPVFGPFHGSAQKLNNGNYLINTAGMFDTGNHGGTIIEVSNSQDILSITTTETEWGDNVYSYRAYRIPSIHPNAFSLIIDDLSIHDEEKIIDSENNSISLTIYNQSGYDQPYKISLQDIELSLIHI